MYGDKINKLEDLLKEKLGESRQLTSYKLSRLTAPGENFGSLILKLDIIVRNINSNTEETLEAVAKLLAPNPEQRKLFNVQVTYNLEVNFYSQIVPALKQFEREEGVKNPKDIFPELYGARNNLNQDSNIVDDDAVLILENLKTKGFTTCDRNIGLDLETSLFVLKELAYFHALPVALKLKEPAIFKSKVTSYIFQTTLLLEDLQGLVRVTEQVMKKTKELSQYLSRAQQLLYQPYPKDVRKPWVTIVHNDFWTNNIMLKFENKKAVAFKMVDFQLIEYRSLCADLIFFLFSSVQMRILKQHTDQLLDFYYKHFLAILEELNCDITLFSKESFLKELALVAKEYEYFHLMFMVLTIFRDNDGNKSGETEDCDVKTDINNVSEATKERITYITLEFAKRGWI